MKQNRHLALAEAICVIPVQKAFLNDLQLREMGREEINPVGVA